MLLLFVLRSYFFSNACIVINVCGVMLSEFKSKVSELNEFFFLLNMLGGIKAPYKKSINF